MGNWRGFADVYDLSVGARLARDDDLTADLISADAPNPTVGASLLAMTASRTPHILKIIPHKKTRHKPGFLTGIELKR
ncbi:hypothetical protein [Pseudomonas sp. MAG733B]|uniref:hypothetical protein n=1 Tax=Pseudomonas sp. MAG733B TaxID=3122079 RepID=UPI0030CF39A6